MQSRRFLPVENRLLFLKYALPCAGTLVNRGLVQRSYIDSLIVLVSHEKLPAEHAEELFKTANVMCDVIATRMGKKTMGFHTEASAVPTVPGRRDTVTLEQVQPTDLIHYGLIPEFVGRLPVVSVLSDLDRQALVEILTQPKNALVRQYQRLFEFENVKLRFAEASLELIAAQALERKVGARGLRMILEDLMLDLMYHLPSQRKIREFVVTDEMVKNHEINFSSAFLEKAG